MLNPRGYQLAAQGPTGIVFQRTAKPVFWVGVALAVIGLLALLGASFAGLLFLVIGGAMAVVRFPATVAITLRRDGAESVVASSGTTGPITRDPGGSVWKAIERAT